MFSAWGHSTVEHFPANGPQARFATVLQPPLCRTLNGSQAPCAHRSPPLPMLAAHERAPPAGNEAPVPVTQDHF